MVDPGHRARVARRRGHAHHRLVPVQQAQLRADIAFHRPIKQAPDQLAFVFAVQIVGHPDGMFEGHDKRRRQCDQPQKRGKRHPSGAKPGRDLPLSL